LQDLFPEFDGDFADLVSEEGGGEEAEFGENPEDEMEREQKQAAEKKSSEKKISGDPDSGEKNSDQVKFLKPPALFQLCQVHRLVFNFFGANVGSVPVSRERKEEGKGEGGRVAAKGRREEQEGGVE
jgi:hypothetical protein